MKFDHSWIGKYTIAPLFFNGIAHLKHIISQGGAGATQLIQPTWENKKHGVKRPKLPNLTKKTIQIYPTQDKNEKNNTIHIYNLRFIIYNLIFLK